MGRTIRHALHYWICDKGHRNSDNSLVCLTCLMGVR